MTEPVTSSGAQQTPLQYTCGSALNNQYAFCWPQREGDYYIAVPQRTPQQNDVAQIRSWFGNILAVPTQVSNLPAGLNVPSHSRIYDVTDFIPPRVRTRNGSRDDVVGPNCFQNALVGAGYVQLDGYYVGTDEFRYYLKRDFELTACSRAPAGSLVVYDKRNYLSRYDAGDHAAIILAAGGIVFQKGGFLFYYPYEISTIDGAMQLVFDRWRPSPDDRWSIPTDPESGSDYDYICYQRRSAPLERRTSSTRRDRDWFVPIFEYYRSRLERLKGLTGSAFKELFIDILTIENAWKILGDFGNRVGSISPIDELLGIDNNVVEKYLRFKSLLEEYDKKVSTYVPIRTPDQRMRLYKDYYVRINDNFREELNLYLELMNIENEMRPAVIELFEEKIRSHNIEELAQPGIMRGIPYFDDLNDAISAVRRRAARTSMYTETRSPL